MLTPPFRGREEVVRANVKTSVLTKVMRGSQSPTYTISQRTRSASGLWPSKGFSKLWVKASALTVAEWIRNLFLKNVFIFWWSVNYFLNYSTDQVKKKWLEKPHKEQCRYSIEPWKPWKPGESCECKMYRNKSMSKDVYTIKTQNS